MTELDARPEADRTADVLIVGGGPTGLLLAAELRRAGAHPLVLEQATDSNRLNRSLGLRGVNMRSAQSLMLRGLTEPLVREQDDMFASWPGATGPTAAGSTGARSAGYVIESLRRGSAVGHFSGMFLTRPDDAPTGIPRLLPKQHLIEKVLSAHAAELGVRIETGCQVVELRAEDDAVTAILADGRSVRARYLVGCDGGRSVVRSAAGFAFPGTPPTSTGRIAVAELTDPDAVSSTMRGPGGLVSYGMVPGEISTMEYGGGPVDRDAPMTGEELADSIRRVSGVEVTIKNFEFGTRYTDNTRQVPTYRRGRVLLAGDAAHVHSPVGGQGLNLGLQDAMNLGWKLALVVRGAAPEELLDTYTAERHPVGARVLRNTRAQMALMRPGPQVDAMREVLTETLALPGVNDHYANMMNGLDIDYEPAAARPMVGRFLPSRAALNEAVLNGLTHERGGRYLELAGGDRPSQLAGYVDRVRTASIPCAAEDMPAALLVRPDGYVAWAAEKAGDDGLAEALTRWFGPPAAS